LASNVNSILNNNNQNDSDSDIYKLKEELTKINSKNNEFQNKQIEQETTINELQEKIESLKAKAEQDQIRMKTLQMRSDRYFPYIRFEDREFKVKIPEHKCVCHTCGEEMSMAALQNLEQSKMEVDEREVTPTDGANNLNDTELQLKGMKKVNQALFAIISDIKTKEINSDIDWINSRAFNRLVRNGHQLLQAHEELMNVHQALKDKFEELEKSKEKNLEEIKKGKEAKIVEFQSKLQSISTQMKITEIEKENLKKELNRYSVIDIDILQKTNGELKQQLKTLEDDNKKAKDDLQRLIKEKSTLLERLNALRLEYENLVAKSAEGKLVETNEIIESQSKQIKDLIDEVSNVNNQIKDAYSEMEAIYTANQDLESKVKLSNSKVEDANKRVEKAMEETFKWSRINESCK
jgi:predicted nuclease with TOPRIM domain